MSKAIDKPETQQLKSTQSLDGNTKFMSPEVFKGEKPYSIKADIFSIGQLLVEVDLSSYQEVELDYYECFKKILFYQVFGISDVVKAINIISQQDQIISLILHLGSNKIGSEGTKGIGVGLEILQNLTYLSHDISTNQIGLDGAKCIIASLQKLQKVNNLSLNISSNQIGPKGAKSISADLGKLHNLTNLSLNISWNKVGPEGAKLIGASFERLQNLTNLSLDIKNVNEIISKL
ncbi:hypothetical protein ABPG73_008315 [Tetrahymena malaccensis]